ncbi:MAG: beta-ketoacyl-[acyl-carrier-protein] synthase family protein, partial [Anaerolineae bacterium]|nr:beta-ketoacyl-[acyl-carrier-protein] synthase family protein [Anaerolineae bacterium]
YIGRKLARHTGLAAQMALVAARQAMADAGLVISGSNASRVGIVLNTGLADVSILEAGVRSLLARGPRSVGPFLVPMIMPNGISCVVSIETGAKGPVITTTAACASGTYALLEAYHLLQQGEADIVLAGASESLPGPVALAAFDRTGALSHRGNSPSEASRPFDADRDGFVCGEGAAVLVLETEEHAHRRGACIYAELLGGRLTADAYHITAPDPSGDGAIRAMRGALLNAGLDPEDIDVIFAHGTSTRLNDAIETKAIKAVYGGHAYRLAVTATKSMVGHALGAAGAITSLAAVLSISHDIIPPTINYRTPDPECDLDYVPNIARRQLVRSVMVNAFGFGGQNVAIILRRYDRIGGMR